ncbi:cytochrome P450 [Conidiobolus coronatus NRRL 28638]|uniref:Cytochrome P450 n=1 Tax=Conidiobolus coronatus (strain ATCC 28846 / CBS 209.66 / NRRL 28638) TaxID=796925 RepID=A0A137PCM5_CONC2|nr:cytochrome P450 [Conidiobolus coronatus NRRL 28638]|eukprot:KXN72722.1 cytochrome P450 [Conidiobolus coronatus NRRL 28638]
MTDLINAYSVSGASALIAYLLLRSTRVPDELKHIPSIPFWPTVYKLATGMTMLEIMEEWIPYFEKYGTVTNFLMGKWKIATGDPELLKKITFDHENFDKLTPNEVVPGNLTDKLFGTNILFSNHKVWKKHRRVVNGAFKKGWNLNVFSECVEELFEKLGDSTVKNADIDELMQRVTVEALGREIMGIKFDGISSPSQNEFVQNFNFVMRSALSPVYFIFPSIDRPWNPLRFEAYEKLKQVNIFFDKLISDRKEMMKQDENYKSKDILSLMIESNMKDLNGLTEEDVRYNTLIFFLAGQDTTSFTLSAVLYLLAEHPEIQEKVRQEVIKVLGENEYVDGKIQVPTNEQLNQLEYLYAVIQETMRLYPAVTILTNWVSKNNYNYNGMNLPAGTVIDLYVYAINRNEKYFKNPNTFDPSRFLEGGIDTNKLDSNWFSFGAGNRMCLGQSFTLTQQKIVLSSILRRYRVKHSNVENIGKPLKTRPPFLLRSDNLKLDLERI